MSILLKAMRSLMEEAPPGGGGGDGGKGTPPETFSREYVHELREENKSWRTKHSESETARKAAEDARDKAGKDADDKIKGANTAADQRVIRAELKALAVAAGMVDLDVLKLVDLSKVKLNDAGEVEGADKLMEDLKKSKPHFFAAESTGSGKKPPPKGDQKPTSVVGMSAADYAAEKKKLLKR